MLNICFSHSECSKFLCCSLLPNVTVYEVKTLHKRTNFTLSLRSWLESHFLICGLGVEDQQNGLRSVPDFNPCDFFLGGGGD
jgi:hypothetical protein